MFRVGLLVRDPVSVLHVLLKSSSRALDNQFLTPDMSLASDTAKCQGATNADCRLADLKICTPADVEHYRLANLHTSGFS